MVWTEIRLEDEKLAAQYISTHKVSTDVGVSGYTSGYTKVGVKYTVGQKSLVVTDRV